MGSSRGGTLGPCIHTAPSVSRLKAAPLGCNWSRSGKPMGGNRAFALMRGGPSAHFTVPSPSTVPLMRTPAGCAMPSFGSTYPQSHLSGLSAGALRKAQSEAWVSPGADSLWRGGGPGGVGGGVRGIVTLGADSAQCFAGSVRSYYPVLSCGVASGKLPLSGYRFGIWWCLMLSCCEHYVCKMFAKKGWGECLPVGLS